MADRGLISPALLTGIADAIRAKTGRADSMTPAEMISEIGGIRTGAGSVSGQFTMTARGAIPTITHNLGTDKICVIIRPLDVAPAGDYHATYIVYVNVPALLPPEERWLLDFTGYSDKFSGAVEVDPHTDDTVKVGALSQSPNKNQTSWNQSVYKNYLDAGQFVVTDTTFAANPQGRDPTYVWLAKGTYAYTIYALE